MWIQKYFHKLKNIESAQRRGTITLLLDTDMSDLEPGLPQAHSLGRGRYADSQPQHGTYNATAKQDSS
jgi:hypothetical protein